MPSCCCAFGCTTGYPGYPKTPNVSLHKFPVSIALRREWVRRLHLEKLTVDNVAHRYVCSLHFRESDYKTVRQDTNSARHSRKEAQGNSGLKIRLLKPGAYPIDQLTQQISPEKRPASATLEKRQERCNKRLEMEIEQFEKADELQDLSDLEKKLNQETGIPSGFSFHKDKESLAVYFLTRLEDKSPVISASIVFVDDLKFVRSNILKLTEEGSLGVICVPFQSRVLGDTKIPWLKVATHCLEMLMEDPDHDCSKETIAKASFSMEQLKLADQPLHGRRYSSELLSFSFSLHSASPQAYRILLRHGLLTLPSERTLRRLTKHVGVGSRDADERYLRKRMEGLSESERDVILLLDEIYVRKCLEYSAAQQKLVGYTEEGALAGTVLCFMVTPFHGKYRDVVGFYPINSLNVQKLYGAYCEVASLLAQVGFRVRVICSDNLSTNRSFFRLHLCNGQLQTVGTCPVTGKKVIIMIDPTHNLKNLYNNFQTRQVLKFPSFSGDGSIRTANFGNLVEIFNMERNSNVKMAHKLNLRVLDPKSIQKTSTTLSLSVFHESTHAALLWQSDQTNPPRQDFRDTALYIECVLKLWNILNVKNQFLGGIKRDHTRDPVRSNDQWQLQFLEDFALFLENWENVVSTMPNFGLTKPTFLAVKQTCRAMIEICRLCFDELGFSYVLLGKFTSDRLEGRFSWYRQLSGGNYYISVKQLLENERKIRTLSLIRFSHVNPRELATLDESESATEAIKAQAVDMAAQLSYSLADFDSEITASDANVIYYVTGYLVKNVGKKSCDSCKSYLIDKNIEEMPFSVIQDDVEEAEITQDISSFLRQIDRGGLVCPSANAFGITLKCWNVFNCLLKVSELKEKFMRCPKQGLLFSEILTLLIEEDSQLEAIASPNLRCQSDHDFSRRLIRRFFTCMCKNYVSRVTDDAAKLCETQKAAKKIAKMQGKKL